MKKVISLILAFLISNSIIFMPEIQSLKADSTDCDWTYPSKTSYGNRYTPAECGPINNRLVLFWKLNSEKTFHSPLIVGKNVYVVNGDNIVCVDLETGDIKWRYVPANYKINQGLRFLVYYKEKLYALKCRVDEVNQYLDATEDTDISGEFICIDAKNGKFLWELTIKDITTPVAFDNGRFYYTSYDNVIHSYDVETKKEVWSYKTNNRITRTSIFFSIYKNYFVFAGFNMIYCYQNDLVNNTFTKIWELDCPGNFLYGQPIIDVDKIYLSGYRYKEKKSKTDYFQACYRLENGKEVWKNEFNDKWIGADEISYLTIPCVVGDNVIFPIPDRLLISFDKNTGEIKWLESYNFSFHVILSAYGDTIVVKSNSKINCINSVDGKSIWGDYTDYKRVNIDSNPVTSGGKIINYSGNTLYCYIGYDENLKIPAVLQIEPNPSYVRVDTKRQLKAVMQDPKYKTIETPKNIEWKSADPTIGTIDQNGLFTGKKPGKVKITCKYKWIEDTMEVDVYSPKPQYVQVDGRQKKININTKYQFKYYVADQLRLLLEGNFKVSWSVDGECGSIDQDGIFTATKVGKCTIRIKLDKLENKLEIEVVEFITTNVKSISFDKLIIGTKATKKLLATNNSENDIVIKINCGSEIINIDANKLLLKPNESKEISLFLDSTNLPIGFQKEIELEMLYDTIKIVIPIKISLSNFNPECLLVSPNNADFGFVARGSEKTISIIASSSTETQVNITTDNPAIKIMPNELTLSESPEKIQLTVKASLLPSNDNFNGLIKIIPKNAECKAITMPIEGQTEKLIEIELQIGNKKAYLNNRLTMLDVPPQTINGSTMVPIRFIADVFGCLTEWIKDENSIRITRKDFMATLWIGKNTAEVNGVEKTMSASPVVVEGRTLLPLRFISEAFGAKVNWEAKTKKITIVWEPN